MNYSDVRRWWSTLNDRGFICPVEKWSIVWSNWPIEYFWVFLNIFQYFWIFLRISDYFLVFLNMFEDFLNIFPLFRGEEVHIVWPSWPITIFPRQHHHWLLIWIQAPLLDPFSLQHLRKFRMAWNGPSWCIWNGNLSNLHPKVVGYVENFTLWKSVDEIVTQCNFQRDLHFMCNISLHWLILWNRLMFLIEEVIWSSWYDNDNDNVIWYGSKLRSEWYPDRQTFAPAAPLPKLWPVPILISVKLNILQLTIWSISLDL